MSPTRCFPSLDARAFPAASGQSRPHQPKGKNAINLNTILHADCLKALPMIADASVNFVLTDPPYLANYQARDGRTVPNDDNDRWLQPSFAELYRILAPNSYAVSFYGWPHADRFLGAFRSAGFKIVGHLVFPKAYCSQARNSSASWHLQYKHECAYLLAKGNPRSRQPTPDVLPWRYTGNKLHPTQKPLEALKPLVVAFSDPGDTILDPFAGSGSSLVAAKQLGRNYIGIELDATYHAAACRRLADEPEQSVA